MFPLIGQSMAWKNIIEIIQNVVKLNGQRSKLVKFMFVQALNLL